MSNVDDPHRFTSCRLAREAQPYKTLADARIGGIPPTLLRFQRQSDRYGFSPRRAHPSPSPMTLLKILELNKVLLLRKNAGGCII